MVKYRITPETVPSEGILFVDHESAHRSGHLSHALVEYAPGHVLSFYSNCSPSRNKGHNGFGWIEYRRSTDGARTWGDAVKLPYSVNAFFNEPWTVSCEKAVSIKENEILLFCTRCENPNGWEPYLTPTLLKSTDGGETWKEMGEICPEQGRIYDVIAVNGTVYVLQSCNYADKAFYITDTETQSYRIWESTDGGTTFRERGRLPGDLSNRAYGAMELTPNGELICYLYNIKDEFHLDTFVSPDFGRTWTSRGTSFCAKRIRNPQVTRVRGGYILHGRSGLYGDELPYDFVLYTSEDGIRWDEGVYIGRARGWGSAAFYSNNLVLNEGCCQRVLIQSSVAYDEARTNICHWYLDIE